MSGLPTPYSWTAVLRGGEFDCARRPILADRERDEYASPPDTVHAAVCPCCNRVVVWEPGCHPRERDLPEPVVYHHVAADMTGNAYYELEPLCPN